ncbi:hypothetical protein C8N35_101803 [Breoghania corrubedonensis]|uniref:tRNA threonylcarbamoyladenosine biosynthesis protein TsaE n=1 Tax=Breoghania corrubedonensis TaxID=665038 RepID=A0A2T5VG79_9HYPH|nr:tRNA (adenosine(37)-N6)-threonylcarbamoyltransferase complex ATPase subunit type 1 TsaE [Breoghania corrubedonensis]PTW62755.1 hypothetical protein C8N35_101803 [Breoghania corrubedonensis]
MSNLSPLRVDLASEAATHRLAEDLAMILRPGDAVALHGDLGAGKTTLARALLRILADDPQLEVPSPTFTLVQPYDLARFPVAHLDLYRTEDPEEIVELGLDDMLAEGAVLIEWPERAEGMLPADTLWLVLEPGADANSRVATFSADAGDWAERLPRTFQLRTFLHNARWRDATRRFLQGDASARRYETVDTPARHAIAMNAPARPDGPPVREGKPYSRIAHLAEDVRPFVAIGTALRNAGFRAPEIYAADLEEGFLLIEDLGRGAIVADGAPIAERYEAAVELLADLHARVWPGEVPVGEGSRYCLPRYDRDALMIEAELYLDWYVPDVTGAPVSEDAATVFRKGWDRLICLMETSPTTWVLRDYHSPNLIWRNGKAGGRDRLGLIDFQDAVIGPEAYDLASLAQDARVTVPAELEQVLVQAYVDIRRSRDPEFDEAALRRDYAILAAHRVTKIIGIFTRLARRDGKPGYLVHMPRLFAYLERSLSHPELSDIKLWYDRFAPR